MIVPEYWAEARRQHRGPSRQVTVRRFGWSNESQSAAQAHADERADAALALAISDARVPRRELKVPYNGADGLPIREEVIDRHESYVITRNSYGALCLNTSNTLFADIDISTSFDMVRPFFVCLLLGVALQLATGSYLLAAIVGLLVFASYDWLKSVTMEKKRSSGRLAKDELARIEQRSQQFPDWSLRVYRTPAGFRILVTDRMFDPSEADVARFFQEFRVDPVYRLMCRNQQCFRARLTAKPWRIGMTTRLRPRPGVWPVHPDRLADRLQWVEQYQAIAKDYAACQFVKALGNRQIHPLVQPVLEIHDRLSQASSGRPLA